MLKMIYFGVIVQLKEIKSIDETIKQLKDKDESTKGVRRDKNKKVFNNYKRFFDLMMRKWVEDHEQEMQSFYHNLHILHNVENKTDQPRVRLH